MSYPVYYPTTEDGRCGPPFPFAIEAAAWILNQDEPKDWRWDLPPANPPLAAVMFEIGVEAMRAAKP